MAAGLSSALRTARHRVPSAAVRNYSRSTPVQQPAWGPATCGGKDYHPPTKAARVVSDSDALCVASSPRRFPSPRFPNFLGLLSPHKSHDFSLLRRSWHLLGSCFFAFTFPFPCLMLLRVHGSSCILRPHPQNVTSRGTFLSPFLSTMEITIPDLSRPHTTHGRVAAKTSTPKSLMACSACVGPYLLDVDASPGSTAVHQCCGCLPSHGRIRNCLSATT